MFGEYYQEMGVTTAWAMDRGADKKKMSGLKVGTGHSCVYPTTGLSAAMMRGMRVTGVAIGQLVF